MNLQNRFYIVGAISIFSILVSSSTMLNLPPIYTQGIEKTNKSSIPSGYVLKQCPYGETLISGKCISFQSSLPKENITLLEDKQTAPPPVIEKPSCPPGQVGTPPGNCRPLPTLP